MKPYYVWLAIGLGVGIILLAIGQWTLWHRMAVEKNVVAELAASVSNATAKVADPYAGIARDVQPIVANVPPAHQLYTPTRLEWLLTELSANHTIIALRLGFQAFFLPPDADDPQTIKLVLYCNSQTDPKEMLKFVKAMKQDIELRQKLVGWDWLKIKEVYLQSEEGEDDKYPGLKPYSLTRLEWLAVKLNASYSYTDAGRDGYSITFIPIKSDTLMILVQYIDKVDRMAMSISVEACRKCAEKERDLQGWSWLQIKEEYKFLKAPVTK